MPQKHIYQRVQPRAFVQVFITLMALGTGMASFFFSIRVQHHVEELNDNFQGNPVTPYLPCIRQTLEDLPGNQTCHNSRQDKCWDMCCPAGYQCQRSPTVGLYCMDGKTECGDFNWCRDFADIPQTCDSDVCNLDKMVEQMVVWSFVLSGVGVIFDIIDIVMFFAAPDSVLFKAIINLIASCIKWIAFGIIVGANTPIFFAELRAAKCYNKLGNDMVATASGILTLYMVLQVFSGTMSLFLAPLSAYYGGKLSGIPKKRRVATMPRRHLATQNISARAFVQVFLTLMALGTGMASFFFAIRVTNYTDLMNDNFRGQPTTEYLPCVRQVLEECGGSGNDAMKTDQCWDRCCPQGYMCNTDPIVSIYCIDGANSCSEDHFQWCRDFADVANDCATDVCKMDKMVERMVVWAFILAGLGVIFDIVDIVMFFASPDAVLVKSVVNLMGSCVKFIAFGVVVGANTPTFLTELRAAMCYNPAGSKMVKSAQDIVTLYIILQVFSGTLSLFLAPISAYFGGKLSGIPYVK